MYLSSVVKLPKDQKVYVVGMSGLEEELKDEGVAFIGGTVSFVKACAIYLSLIRIITVRIQRTTRSNHHLTGSLLILVSVLSSLV